MSYYFRDKPRFSDRLRGNSGDDLMESLKRQFDQDSKLFFEPTSSQRSSREREQPFDQRHINFPRVRKYYFRLPRAIYSIFLSTPFDIVTT